MPPGAEIEQSISAHELLAGKDVETGRRREKLNPRSDDQKSSPWLSIRNKGLRLNFQAESLRDRPRRRVPGRGRGVPPRPHRTQWFGNTCRGSESQGGKRAASADKGQAPPASPAASNSSWVLKGSQRTMPSVSATRAPRALGTTLRTGLRPDRPLHR